MADKDASANPPTFNPPVFYTSGVLLLALVIYASVFQSHAQVVFTVVQNWILTSVSWR